MGPTRRPHRRVRGTEESDNGDTDGGDQMRDPGVVADVGIRMGEPPGQLPQILQPHRAFQCLLGPGAVFDRQMTPQFEEILELPVLAAYAGEGMARNESCRFGIERKLRNHAIGSAHLPGIEVDCVAIA